MKVKFVTPFRKDKDLGLAYNDEFRCTTVRMEDWICLRDIDTMFLTHDAPSIIEDYCASNADAGILTCYTNRIGNHQQLYLNTFSQSPNMVEHYNLAMSAKERKTTTDLFKPISGMLMCINKKFWQSHNFKEGMGCLGVDTEYSTRVLAEGHRIARMDAIYIFHWYRLTTGVHNKAHLK